MTSATIKRRKAFALGLYVSGATCPEGHCRTHQEIAAFVTAAGAPVSWQRIWQIEQRALRHLRAKLYCKHPALVAAMEHMMR